MRGVLVTGTDTEVGKTVVAGCICAGLAARGERVVPYKPVVTGLDEPVPEAWPRDHELLAAAAGGGIPADDVAPECFGPAVSPHLAAELAEQPLQLASLVAAASTAAARAHDDEARFVCEGVGGLLVPLASDGSVRDFAVALELPLVVVARPGLGTINHTLLTLAAARAVGLEVLGVVITPWPDQPTVMQADNRATIARLGEVEVATLPPLRDGHPPALRVGAAALPLDRWLP